MGQYYIDDKFLNNFYFAVAQKKMETRFTT